ncbi:TauD/TfdA family dioxygenase [Streptomyces sp. V4-01]|uniref:TauD/TfdA family dioxygenase n=1 Tax=Actinacidiphila polyblastidii TaxID=3110430 RepID=A0ABU7PB38_9ACTN|nr:TauD/TfdA family dioxygenase [Streptomyces sp. V4-01]
MPSTPLIAPVEPDRRYGRPPMLHVRPPADPEQWVRSHRDPLLAAVAAHGSVLVRGLRLRTPEHVALVLEQLEVPPVTEQESFAPRQPYAEGVYPATKWPQNEPMCMHHELSYNLDFPGLLLFACLTAPTDGGATAVADASAVVDALPHGLVERFERQGWILTRSYNGEIGASVAEAFGTDDHDAVDSHCRAAGIDVSWQHDGTLRTRQRRSAVLRHPVDGRRCWFNQIAFLNEWTINPDIREYLIGEYGADGLPFNTFWGDGEPLTQDAVQQINRVYEAHTSRTPWLAGDLLLVDNIRTAHSREPFTGPREVAVAMAAPRRVADCSPTIEVNPS